MLIATAHKLKIRADLIQTCVPTFSMFKNTPVTKLLKILEQNELS